MSSEQAGPAAGSGPAHLAAAAATGQPSGLGRPGRRARVLARLQAVWRRVQHTRAFRANARFGRAGGGVLTGGIAYSALFSLGAGLTLGWTVFMAVLGRDPVLRAQVLDAVDATLPGLVDTGDGTGALSPSDLRLSPALTVAGVVAVVVLLVSAMTAMGALRTGVRAMFGEPPTAGNALLAQVRSLAGLVGLAGAILLSAVLTIAATSAADWLLGFVGWSGPTAAVVIRGVGLAVSFAVDAATFLLVVYVLANQRPAWRDLAGGALVAAVGIGVVRLLGTSVVAGSADRNPLLASVAVVATLLVWLNLIARIVLLAAAWVADPPLADDDAEQAAVAA